MLGERFQDTYRSTLSTLHLELPNAETWWVGIGCVQRWYVLLDTCLSYCGDLHYIQIDTYLDATL